MKNKQEIMQQKHKIWVQLDDQVTQALPDNKIKQKGWMTIGCRF